MSRSLALDQEGQVDGRRVLHPAATDPPATLRLSGIEQGGVLLFAPVSCPARFLGAALDL